MPYKIRDRFKEWSSWAGVLLIGFSVWLGLQYSPADPTHYLPLVLQLLGAFGIAIPSTATVGKVADVVEETAKRAGTLALALWLFGLSLVLSACGMTTAQITALSTASAATVADLQAIVAQAQTSGTIPASAIPTIQADIAKIQADVAANSTQATILADVNLAITAIGPFLPTILTLVGVGTPTAAQIMADPPVVTQMRIDYAALKLAH